MSLIIALPRERRPGERRVALDPSRVERLAQAGIKVRIEADCGHFASFHDDHYQDVDVCNSFADVVRDADIVAKVVCPTLEEITHLKPGSVLICIMSAFQHLQEVEHLRRADITVLAMDHMPRTTRAQPMDALSSQATVAGYKAALLAAELSPRLFPMLTTAAGTIRPARVLVIGAGVAGLQAIATARRLGAQVEAYDVRRAAKEQIESLGARMVDTGVEVEGAGGFARSLRKDERQKQHDVLADHMARAHVVICAASIPGRRAPRIITEDMVNGMLPESVIVDVAAGSGGNCELTRAGEHYHHNDTLIVGPLNLPSHGAVNASEMYSRNVHGMLELIVRDNAVVLDNEDDIIRRCIICHAKQINHAPTADLLEYVHTPFGGMAQTGAVQSGAAPKDAESKITLRSIEKPDDSSIDWLEEPEDLSDILDESTNENRVSAVLQDDTQELPEAVGPGPNLDESLVTTDSLQSDSALEAEPQGPVSATDGVLAEDGGEQMPSEDKATVDDLTLIDGVGPALQERLYAFGFNNFEDIASLDAQGVEKLAVQLELEDEVEKQAWPAQANALIQERDK